MPKDIAISDVEIFHSRNIHRLQEKKNMHKAHALLFRIFLSRTLYPTLLSVAKTQMASVFFAKKL